MMVFPCPQCRLSPIGHPEFNSNRGHGFSVTCTGGPGKRHERVWGPWAKTKRGAEILWNKMHQKAVPA